MSWEKLSTSLLQWHLHGRDEIPKRLGQPSLPSPICQPCVVPAILCLSWDPCASPGLELFTLPVANLPSTWGWQVGSPLFQGISSL